jgi:hypothetical protein
MPTDIAIDEAAGALQAPTTAGDGRSLAWTCGVIAVITVLLALFSAASMKSWSETLAPTPTNLVIRQAAEGWYDTTEHLGLASPRAGLRSLWQSWREAKFPQPPGVAGEDPTIQR